MAWHPAGFGKRVLARWPLSLAVMPLGGRVERGAGRRDRISPY